MIKGTLDSKWKSGYVPNCVILEDGEFKKNFAGNSYKEEVA
eukprot:CAMPEP_0169396266 /NCGR_PEP_ID=MMETSP1017-20121227/51203_1 /TAXON_ID=342587 /ORGANISM="Karlodinium micrum, Strain CCMP2283" /LENGTH=40 /DNA_ID= /DNA_START= /DNA_END= /DNA_ORIENTATION=